MKNNRARIKARREEILQELRENSHVSVRALAEKFHVSLLTIRRDLQFLENEHKLERFYGGAAPLEEEARTELRDETSGYRDQIARYAASLVEDDDTIFINTSSTALRMIPYIKSRHVTVITNNGRVIDIPHSPDVSIILSGGELRQFKGAMTGEFAVNNLGVVMAKKSFLGCVGGKRHDDRNAQRGDREPDYAGAGCGRFLYSGRPYEDRPAEQLCELSA